MKLSPKTPFRPNQISRLRTHEFVGELGRVSDRLPSLINVDPKSVELRSRKTCPDLD